jgi:hypothetical protein
MDRWDSEKELNELFANYKTAVPDPDSSANFMPGLWGKIEARRSFTLRVRKLTQVFMGAAAALCLLFAMIEVVPSSATPEMHGTYVDMLAATHPADNLTALGIAPRDPTEPTTK